MRQHYLLGVDILSGRCTEKGATSDTDSPGLGNSRPRFDGGRLGRSSFVGSSSGCDGRTGLGVAVNGLPRPDCARATAQRMLTMAANIGSIEARLIAPLVTDRPRCMTWVYRVY